MRALAGIMHALLEATGDGHCALPKEELVEQAAKLLDIDVVIVREALERLLLDGELLYEPIGGHDFIYLLYLRRAGDGIACLLRKLASEHRRTCRQSMLRKLLRGASGRREGTGGDTAGSASKSARITGGPEVGKTTLVDSIL
jgi:exodeoxyribonuclease V alpha subunit